MYDFTKENLNHIRDAGATQTEKDLAENLLSMWSTLLEAVDSSAVVKDALFDSLHMEKSKLIRLTFSQNNWRDESGSVWIKPEPGKWLAVFDKPSALSSFVEINEETEVRVIEKIQHAIKESPFSFANQKTAELIFDEVKTYFANMRIVNG